MTAFIAALQATLRLHFRNRMAIIYSYLFPTIFLIAFWMLYRHERVPLARHMGELLTVTALGGACFGLPTTMVSERERGVWRRYRLAPVATGTLLGSTVLARYVLLVLAGLLQVLLAIAIGMPIPNHPFDLFVAFSFVAFALLGLGLVIATMADNVPAVQALGQCIFLPMLMIGGVAVQLASLPEWALHVSAFFPGRYAVEAMQAAVTGGGLPTVGFSLLALALIGAAGMLAGVKMFRWEPQQRFVMRAGKGWAVVALAAWAAVGVLAEAKGYVMPGASVARVTVPVPVPVTRPDDTAPSDPTASAPRPDVTLPAPPSAGPPDAAAAKPEPAPPATPPPAPETKDPPKAEPPAPSAPEPTAKTAKPSPAPEKPADTGTTPTPDAAPRLPAGAPPPPPPEPDSWRDVTPAHIEEVMFERLPPDSGVVSPIAPIDEPLEPDIAEELEEVRSRLPNWPPAKVADPVQRVRNVLYVAAVPDVFQLPIERYLPHVVFERLQEDIPQEDLIKILFWIATHPNGGDDSALDQLRGAGLMVNGPADVDQTRERVMLYALKLLGRLVGKLSG